MQTIDIKLITSTAIISSCIASFCTYKYLHKNNKKVTRRTQSINNNKNNNDDNNKYTNEINKLNQLREEERRGRIKAEQALREIVLKKQEKDGYVYHSIGTLKSCYPTRNGTPRQPQLVPSGRATLKLSKHIPASSINSLNQFSHCWILFVFNDNTNMHQKTSLGKPKTTIKGKVKPPQLNGKKLVYIRHEHHIDQIILV